MLHVHDRGETGSLGTKRQGRSFRFKLWNRQRQIFNVALNHVCCVYIHCVLDNGRQKLEQQRSRLSFSVLLPYLQMHLLFFTYIVRHFDQVGDRFSRLKVAAHNCTLRSVTHINPCTDKEHNVITWCRICNHLLQSCLKYCKFRLHFDQITVLFVY